MPGFSFLAEIFGMVDGAPTGLQPDGNCMISMNFYPVIRMKIYNWHTRKWLFYFEREKISLKYALGISWLTNPGHISVWF